LASETVRFCQEKEISYRTLQDGDVLIVDTNTLTRKI
jgi:hypothetical protein